jgi:hypothetical protein
MKVILPYLDQGETVSVSGEVLQMSEVAEYFYRYKKIVFDSQPGQQHYLSIYTASVQHMDDSLYSEMNLPTEMYKLKIKN